MREIVYEIRCAPSAGYPDLVTLDFASGNRRIFEAARRQGCPPGLVTRADPVAVIPMEILVEQHQVLPIRVSRVVFIAAMTWTASVGVR